MYEKGSGCMKKTDAVVKLIKSYHRFDACAWVLLGSFILGFVCSAVLIRFELNFIFSPAKDLANRVMFGFSSLGFWQVFFEYFAFSVISYVFVLLLGLFVPGEAL